MEAAHAPTGNALPEGLHFNDFELAWRLFTLLEATEWRWPPSVLERQSESLMDDLLQLRGLVGQVEREMFPPKAADGE